VYLSHDNAKGPPESPVCKICLLLVAHDTVAGRKP
jgi:hypothetical protein